MISFPDTVDRQSVRVETALGQLEVVWLGEAVQQIGWCVPQQARSGVTVAELADRPATLSPEQSDLVEKLIDYCHGAAVSFRQVRVDVSWGTPLQQRIWHLCQQIPYGQVVTYGDLARQAGRPGAARAVGSTMAKNRLPLIIPCHRVVAAGNRLGGFSSPQGVGMKRKLLTLESAAASTLR